MENKSGPGAGTNTTQPDPLQTLQREPSGDRPSVQSGHFRGPENCIIGKPAFYTNMLRLSVSLSTNTPQRTSSITWSSVTTLASFFNSGRR